MLQNRGYVVVQDAIDMATEEFKNRFGETPARGLLFPLLCGGNYYLLSYFNNNQEALTILVEKADDPSDQLFVFFPDDEKVWQHHVCDVHYCTVTVYCIIVFIRWE